MATTSSATIAATLVISVSCLVATSNRVASAAEIKLLSPIAFQPVMDELAPSFEKSSGHKVTIDYSTSGAIADRIPQQS